MLLLVLYLPYLYSLSISAELAPIELFWTCWGGHFLIYLLSFSGWLTPLPKDRPFLQQFFRPFIYTQLIYTLITGVSSIFFFWDKLGYFYLEKVSPAVSSSELNLIAIIEQHQLLAHAALAHGLLFTMKYYPQKPQDYYYKNKILSNNFYQTVFIILGLSVLLSLTGAFSGISTKLTTIVVNLFLLSFVEGLKTGKRIALTGSILLGVIGTAAISGMKEGIFTIGIFFALYFFPKKPILTTVLSLIGLFYFFDFYIPLTLYIRKYSWYGQQTSLEVFQMYWDEYTKDLVLDKDKLQWTFLIQRLSLLETSVKYFGYVPLVKDFYGWQLISDMSMSIIPAGMRWDNLTIETTAMERAIECGAVERYVVLGGTSVKPTFFEDSYVLGGTFTVFICHFIWGFLANLMGVWCEKLFGGYEIGCIVLYLGACNQFNIVASFENAFSSTIYAAIVIIALFYVFKETKVLEKNN